MTEPIDLIGTWQFTRDDQPAFLHFTYTQAFDYFADGEQHQLMRLWYELEEPHVLRFRSRPEEAGWTCLVKVKGDSLVLTSDQLETICTRATAEAIPAWFVRELAKKS